MAANKLKTKANIDGGVIQNVTSFNTTEVIVEEDTARLPSYYRALAVAADDEWTRTQRVARATVSAPGASVAGQLRTRAPVDTAEPVVQKYEADDGTWRRKSTDESTWSGWIKQFDDTDNRPAVADLSDSTVLAQKGSDNAFTTDQTIVSTDAGAALGPGLILRRNSASPANNDLIGAVAFQGNTQTPSGGTSIYSLFGSQIVDISDATPDGRLYFSPRIGGTLSNSLYIGSGVYTKNMTDMGNDSVNAGFYCTFGTQVVWARQTGWTAATGTATRTTFATTTVTTELLAQRVKALIDDLITHGLIGA